MPTIMDMINESLRKDFALPGVDDLVPSPGELAHSAFGGKSIDNLAKGIGSSLKSSAQNIGSSLPKPPSL